MISLFAVIGIVAVLFLILKLSSEKQQDNKELLKLAQYSDECKQVWEKAKKPFARMTESNIQREQLRLLGNSAIRRKAEERKQKIEHERQLLSQAADRQAEDSRFYWRRDHTFLYRIFEQNVILKESDLLRRIAVVHNQIDEQSAKEILNTWEKFALIKKGGGKYDDNSSVPRTADAVKVGKFMIEPGDDLEILSGTKGYTVVNYIETHGFYLLPIDLSDEGRFYSLDELRRWLNAGYYRVKYEGEYVYMINFSSLQRELVEQGIIESRAIWAN